MPEHSLPEFSFVICSRNDGYGGNSLWRLQTALNHLAHVATQSQSALMPIEVIVTDWGSPGPLLADALLLSEAAAEITRFIEVPHELASKLGGASDFPESIANNVAVRRSSGQFIGRIDQDTLVSRKFLDCAASVLETHSKDYIFIGRRSIPIEFARQSFGIETVWTFLERFSKFLPREGEGQCPWFDAPMGAEILHRDQWHACHGYDETLLKWGFMGTDLALRIGLREKIINLGSLIGSDFYHLAHAIRRPRVTTRIKNPRRMPAHFRVNDNGWGLADYDLPLRQVAASCDTAGHDAMAKAPNDPPGVLRFGPAVALDVAWNGAMSAVRTMRGWIMKERFVDDG